MNPRQLHGTCWVPSAQRAAFLSPCGLICRDVSLVGRVQEMAQVRLLLEGAAGGAGGVVVVTGPSGSGKSALVEAAVEEALRRGFCVARAAAGSGLPGRFVWAQLLRDADGAGALAESLLNNPRPLDLDAAARALTSDGPRLVVVEDLDRSGPEAVEFLSVLASRAGAASAAVIVTAAAPVGVGHELRLGGVSEEDLAAVVGEVPPEARHALWVVSGGLPGLARSLADKLAGLGEGDDPIAYLALQAAATAPFLEVDVRVVRLLETAADRASDDATRARVLARLARELLGDASAGPRRRALVDEALVCARRAGEPRILAEVLDARLHALWDPDAAADRLTSASEIMDLARACGDEPLGRQGLFWRFVALMEHGRIGEAESALAAFDREATLAGDGDAVMMAKARHAMLAILRGRFDEAERLTQKVGEDARRLESPDAEDVVGALRASIAAERDLSPGQEAVEQLLALARRRPGHFFEAQVAWILAEMGRTREAELELGRVLPRVLAGSGPRWLNAAADLATTAALVGKVEAARQLNVALAPYRGRLVLRAGAVSTWGPVNHRLGLLAAALGRLDDAVEHFEEAIAWEGEVGALPYLAHSRAALADVLSRRSALGDVEAAEEHRLRARSLAEGLGMTRLIERLGPSADEWTLTRDGDDWLLEAGPERARLRHSRGLQYLRALVASPGREISALDLVAGGPGLVASTTGPTLDDTARAAYRQRVSRLDADLDAADRAGDAAGAERLNAERQALLYELRRATGLGGRMRETTPEAERARVNVTRSLRATLERLSETAPRAASHLRASIRTGRACRYQPAPGGPARWRI